MFLLDSVSVLKVKNKKRFNFFTISMRDSTFQALKEYFDAVEEREKSRNGHRMVTEVGIFSPSSLIHINLAIRLLIDTGMIDPSRLFLDAGCGDGRVVALTAGVYRIPSIGVEYDGELADSAKKNIRNLEELSILNGTPVRIVRGLFESDMTYSDEGVRFEDISTVFNYIDNQRRIAAKIADQSPPGTLFLFQSTHAEEFDGLTLECSLELFGPNRTGHIVHTPQELDPKLRAIYLHVYRK